MGTKARVTVMALFLALVAVFGFGQTAQAALSAVSATVDPVNGFPVWYQDSTGLQLDLCLDAANCLTDPIDPANPDSVALGIGAEGFYFAAEALMPMTGGQALLVLALEAAFGGATGEPVIGEQIVFARTRIRIDAPVAGQYVVTHPYGIETFDVQVPGIRAINSEVGAPHIAGNVGLIGDIGCVALPCDFSLALGGLIGPYLSWDPAVPPAATAGFLGNPFIEHQITGSPIGQNIFRVDGPAGSNLDGLGNDFVETNLFSVSGRIFAAFPPSANFSRDLAGAGNVTIRFSGPAGAVVTVVGDVTPLPGEPLGGFPMPESLTEPGVFEVVIPILAADVLPATVTITSDLAGNIRTAPGVLVTDLVVITSATFDTGTLTVVADSADDFTAPLPVLTVTDPGAVVLGTIDTAVANTLTLAGVAMPAEVIVTSTGGGVARATVTDLTPAPADPGAGGLVPGAGGGGSGGCFIGELFN